ncbi:MAG TPA: XdhC family protein [Aliidongia sp.]|uniref:XdhC family protein n=1 Tax=Aliidongia sp. TaxID=1914230 RepID=UPI002DDDB2C5|nr:XdhC family protein [Aliidongia sp.]HEV2676951.1 XdhC family protein [Aliidongia sp.]
MKIDLLERRLAAQQAGKTTVLVTDLKTGAQMLLGEGIALGDLALGNEERAAINRAAIEDRSQTIDSARGTLFVEVWSPPLRLIVVGAVHIAQTLARMAVATGYDVTIIDPRSAFASEERFPGVTLATDWPDEVLPALKPDKRTAIVTLTHDPKIDDPALQAALRSDAFYIGALGSRRTHGKRGERLAAAGFDAGAFARIHGPVGLDIGALTPGEIAVSILAQITATLRRDRIKAKEDKAA